MPGAPSVSAIFEAAAAAIHIPKIHPSERWRTLTVVMSRAKATLEVMESLDFIQQTSEFARVFGIDFFSVLDRGSQYRVESMLMRLARPQGFTMISPSPHQVSRFFLSSLHCS